MSDNHHEPSGTITSIELPPIPEEMCEFTANAAIAAYERGVRLLSAFEHADGPFVGDCGREANILRSVLFDDPLVVRVVEEEGL